MRINQQKSVRIKHERRDKAGDADDAQRQPPIAVGGEGGDQHRRGGVSEGSGDAVDGIGAAEPALAHAVAEDRQVGGMKNAVAEPAEQGERQEHPIGRRHARQGDRQGQHGDAGDEQTLRAVAVDQDAGRRLAQPGRDIEQRHDEAEFGEAHAEFVMEDGEERRQRQLHYMARIMGHADQRRHRRVALPLFRRRRHHER